MSDNEFAVAEMTTWRHHLHTIPETAFEEVDTSNYVAGLLESFGLTVERGLGKTGVVGTLKNGQGPAIGLRAELDALDIQETTNRPYRSQHAGKMHACGHDGHMAMLLGAAKHLAHDRNFRGTLHFIFQPAEENEGGAKRMIADGLFERFPVDAVYAMHNWPGLEFGRISACGGPIMAASDMFEIVLKGRSVHAGMPHQGPDAVVAAAEIVSGLQTISSRAVHPADPCAVSVTQIHGGTTWNVIPAEIVLRGTARSFSAATRDRIEACLRAIVGGVATIYGIEAQVAYDRRYPPTVNHTRETAFVADVCRRVFGESCVTTGELPSMGAEDFAYMLEKKPGCFTWIGSGPAVNGHILHNEGYDFNDQLLPLGVRYWTELVKAAAPA